MIRAYLLGFASLRGLLALIGVAALCAAIWLGGPFLVVGSWAPLVPVEIRAGAIALILVLFFGGTLLRLILARRANARMIRSLLDSGATATAADAGEAEELAVLRERFEQALATLKDTLFAGRKGDNYVFELPWYVILGAPRTGKTTILRQSGLDFPLRRRVGEEPVSGLGVTQHCDWWFTDRAVLIDTPGRYAMQDDQAATDKAGWRDFLSLLKTHRSRRPLDGVLLAVSLPDILLQSETERARHIAALRHRLQELTRTCGAELPVYVVITKCDLLPGFSDFFSGLDKAGREQVLGMTFPPDADVSERLSAAFAQRFTELCAGLDPFMRERAHAERTLSRRSDVYLFPKEFAAIGAETAAFLSRLFTRTRFEAPSRLRGVYFTSGTQEGNPIDRLGTSFGRDFGLTPAERPVQLGQGKPYFVHKLLTEVVFLEQGLVGADPRVERSLVFAQNTGYAVAATLVLGFIGFWWTASSRGDTRIEHTARAIKTLEARLIDIPARPNPATLLPILQAVDGVRSASGEDGVLAWLDGFALSAVPALAPAAEDLYRRILLDRLFPALGQQVGDHLAGLLRGGADVPTIRQMLRSYLMIGDASRFDAAAVRETAREEARLAFPSDQDRAAALNRHFDALIAVLPKSFPLDQGIVDAARLRLTRTPRSEQAYARLLREAGQNPRLRPLDLTTAIGFGALRFVPGPKDEAVSIIPAAFTRDAFYDFILPRLPTLVREELGVDWVTAGEGGGSLVQLGTREVMDRYVADYIRAWQAALNAVRLVPSSDPHQAMAALQALAGPSSPLDTLLGVLRTQTDLPVPGSQPETASRSLAASVVTSTTSSLAGAAAKATFGEGTWPGTTIGNAFRPLTEMVTPPPGGGQPIMARIRELFSAAYGAMSTVSTASNAKQAAFQAVARRGGAAADAIIQLRADSALRPEPVRGIMRAVASTGSTAMVDDALTHINEAWQRDVMPQCLAAIGDRYPLSPNARDDVTLKDFSDMFRPGGVLDDFFQKNIAPFVVEQRNGYVPATIDGEPLPLKPQSLAQFYRAKAIRTAFFGGNGSAPSLKFSIRPSFLDARLLRATLSIDGRDIVYRHEAPRAYDIEWPTKTDASTVAVTLTDLNGKETVVERSGAWAILRLVDAASLAVRGGTDQFSMTVKGPEGASVVYQLKASSVSNPLNLGILRGFRCPDTL